MSTAINSVSLTLFYLKGSVVLTSLIVGWIGGGNIFRVHRTQWWDQSPSGPNQPLEWEQVLALMEDPLKFRPRWRLSPSFLGLEVIGFLFVIGLLSFAWIYLQRFGTTIGVGQLRDVGIAFGGFSALLALVGVAYQVRATTRSANRQAWINEMRNALTPLIANLPEWRASEHQVYKAQNVYVDNHARLEMLLNPSECDHRALQALLRFFYRFDPIHLDDDARRVMELDDKEIKEQIYWSNKKTELIRLTNAVLKREWEQVKHVR